MLSSVVLHSVRARLPATSRAFGVTAARSGGHLSVNQTAEGREYTHPKIGNREIVGWGFVGHEKYLDLCDFPFPAIRFKEPDAPGVCELREKEKGDWTCMTLEEKKALYRASFCQTYAEINAKDTGFWKEPLGMLFFALTFSLWIWIFCQYFVFYPKPESLSPEGIKNSLIHRIAIRDDPVTGISSKWDYENDQWKE